MTYTKTNDKYYISTFLQIHIMFNIFQSEEPVDGKLWSAGADYVHSFCLEVAMQK